MRIKRYLQLNKEEVLQSARKLSNQPEPRAAVISVVYNRNNSGEWKYLIGKCEFYDTDEDIEEIYSEHAFVRKVIKNFVLQNFIDALEGEGYKVADELPSLLKDEKNTLSWSEETVPGHLSASGYPEKQFSSKLARNTQFDEGFLLGYRKEFHSSAREYLMSFMSLPVYHGQSHGDNGAFSIFLPDQRGRIIYEDKTLSIKGFSEELSLVGEIYKKGRINIGKPNTLDISERDFKKSELWLLGKNNEVLDYRSTTDWRYRRINDSEDYALADQVLSMAEEGENLEIEFKPFIDLKNSKAEQIERTVCAFSNAKGGNLLLGVEDDTTITGIDDCVLKHYGGPISKAIDTYIKEVKRRLQEKLRYGQCFSVSNVQVGEKHVLLVRVERTEKPNYYINTGQGFIRKSGTSAKMKSSDERENPNGSSDLLNYR